MQSVLAHKDTLVLLPTGGGKSLCYQIPALAKEGICIVVSPLIALMKDQVANLQRRGIEAEALYTGMHYREMDQILEKCAYAKVKLLYLSPERLHTELFVERLKKMKVNLLAIDEAHCISQWGHDFRPAYLNIAKIKEFIPDVPVIALTATATKRVKEEIVEKLELNDVQVFQKSFERKNLSYSVLYEEAKLNRMLLILSKVPGTGIVYVRSRKKTEEIAAFLRKNQVSADFYHGGLQMDVRNKKQQAWIDDQTRVMVCTNAFGMGIDKPDVRVVIHLGLPESLEEYYQEAGRAGRDRQKAYAVLLYQENDGNNLRYRFETHMPDLNTIKKIYHSLGSHLQIAIGAGEGRTYELDVHQFAQSYQHRPVHVFHALQTLEQEGYLLLSDGLIWSSRLMIVMDRYQLYNFQVQQVYFDELIKAILRNYGGVMDGYVKISEQKLARVMGRPVSEIIRMLKKLQQYEVLKYEIQTDKPQVTYLRARLTIDNLLIDVDRFLFRYQVKKENIEAVIRYGENKRKCRSRQLLAYFGETDADACGKCDVCVNRRKRKGAVKEEVKISVALQQLLSESEKSVQDLVEELPSVHPEKVIETIRNLADEGQLVLGENDVVTWVKK